MYNRSHSWQSMSPFFTVMVQLWDICFYPYNLTWKFPPEVWRIFWYILYDRRWPKYYFAISN